MVPSTSVVFDLVSTGSPSKNVPSITLFLPAFELFHTVSFPGPDNLPLIKLPEYVVFDFTLVPSYSVTVFTPFPSSITDPVLSSTRTNPVY